MCVDDAQVYCIGVLSISIGVLMMLLIKIGIKVAQVIIVMQSMDQN